MLTILLFVCFAFCLSTIAETFAPRRPLLRTAQPCYARGWRIAT